VVENLSLGILIRALRDSGCLVAWRFHLTSVWRNIFPCVFERTCKFLIGFNENSSEWTVALFFLGLRPSLKRSLTLLSCLTAWWIRWSWFVALEVQKRSYHSTVQEKAPWRTHRASAWALQTATARCSGRYSAVTQGTIRKVRYRRSITVPSFSAPYYRYTDHWLRVSPVPATWTDRAFMVWKKVGYRL